MTMRPVKPNFFIVGAPKCGTSSMFQYLKDHPEVFMPWLKEPHFFGSDLRAAKYIRDEAKYLALFQEATGYKRVGEGSTWYLYSKRAAREIHAFDPSARIIVMLRNPVELVYSMHGHNLYMGSEDIADFGAALRAQPERKKGHRIPKPEALRDGLFYYDVGKFTDQVQRYLDVFGRENVHIVLFDDLKRDTPGVYRDTLRFLEVDETFVPNFEVRNPGKRLESQTLQRFIRSPLLQRWGRTLLPRQLAYGVADGLRSLGTRVEARPRMDPHVRARLREGFTPDVMRLSELLGRDLSGWTHG